MKILTLLIVALFTFFTKNTAFSEQPRFQFVKRIIGNIVPKISVDNSGNVYTIGNFSGKIQVDSTQPPISIDGANDDILITKFSPSGKFLWSKHIGDESNENVISGKVDSYGNVYVTGYFGGRTDFDPGPGVAHRIAQGVYDVFLLKLDSLGNFVWVAQFGGPEMDFGTSVSFDASGNVYATGYFKGIADFDPSEDSSFTMDSGANRNLFIVKLDASGKLIWAKNTGGSPAQTNHSMVVDSKRNIYIVGSFSGTVDFDPGLDSLKIKSVGSNDMFILKLDSSAQFVWAKRVGGKNTEFRTVELAVDLTENVYCAGSFIGKVDFDPGIDTFTVASKPNTQTSTPTTDIFIVKLDKTGDFKWVRSIGDYSLDNGNSIALDSRGNIYTTGGFTGTVDFNPGADTVYIKAAGKNDIYILKLDSLGNFMYASNIGSTLNSSDIFEAGYSIDVDKSGNIYTSGIFYGTVDFNPGDSVYNVTASKGSSSFDVFVLKLSQESSTSDVSEAIRTAPTGLSLYPNPTTGSLTVAFGKGLTNGRIKLINLYGQTVLEQLNLNCTSLTIDITGLPSGIYFIEMIEGGKMERVKVMKE